MLEKRSFVNSRAQRIGTALTALALTLSSAQADFPPSSSQPTRASESSAQPSQASQSSQDSQASQDQQPGLVLKMNGELVLTNVVARDPKTGELIQGLKHRDFSIYENGKQHRS